MAIKLHHDGYDHTRLPKAKHTRQKMSEAKKGRTYSDEHKLNMIVSHLLRGCQKNNKDPVDHVTDHWKYTTKEKRAIIKIILQREEDERNARL